SSRPSGPSPLPAGSAVAAPGTSWSRALPAPPSLDIVERSIPTPKEDGKQFDPAPLLGGDERFDLPPFLTTDRTPRPRAGRRAEPRSARSLPSEERTRTGTTPAPDGRRRSDAAPPARGRSDPAPAAERTPAPSPTPRLRVTPPPGLPNPDPCATFHDFRRDACYQVLERLTR